MENDIEENLLLGSDVHGIQEQEQQNISENTEDTGVQDEGLFGKPETYDYSEVELPDNYYYNNDLLKEFNELAAKYNLSQKSANELMSMAVKMTKLAGQNLDSEIENRRKQQIYDYKKALLNDSQIGGIYFDKAIQTANMAYKCFADEDVQALLQETGLNCHPKIVKMFYQIGKLMRNDDFSDTSSPYVKKESREDILFPTM